MTDKASGDADEHGGVDRDVAGGGSDRRQSGDRASQEADEVRPVERRPLSFDHQAWFLPYQVLEANWPRLTPKLRKWVNRGPAAIPVT